jgi:hypothetical protein
MLSGWHSQELNPALGAGPRSGLRFFEGVGIWTGWAFGSGGTTQRQWSLSVSEDHRRERPIQRVLRRKDSQDYFTGSGWTQDIKAARTYHDSMEAAVTCARFGLFDVEMVLRITGGTADLFCTELR